MTDTRNTKRRHSAALQGVLVAIMIVAGGNMCAAQSEQPKEETPRPVIEMEACDQTQISGINTVVDCKP